MARAAKIPSQALEKARVDPMTAILGEPLVASLTERFQEVRRRSFEFAADMSVELGVILKEGQPGLGRAYGRWLAHLNVEPPTARNYVVLAELAQRAPSIYARWKELGVAKLYKLSRLQPQDMHEVLRLPDVRTMNDRAFAVALTPYRRPLTRKVTGNMKAHGLRMKLQAFTRRLRALRVPRITDRVLRRGVAQDVAELTAELEKIGKKLG